MKRLSATALVLLFSIASTTAQTVEMADALRSSGKIYVVVGVLSVIFIGLVFYLFSIDRRVKKMEKRNQL